MDFEKKSLEQNDQIIAFVNQERNSLDRKRSTETDVDDIDEEFEGNSVILHNQSQNFKSITTIEETFSKENVTRMMGQYFANKRGQFQT